MLLNIPLAVVSSHVLAVQACYTSLPSHFRHAGLDVGLGLGTRTENSVISTLTNPNIFALHKNGAKNSPENYRYMHIYPSLQ